jgi:hypothetical protein
MNKTTLIKFSTIIYKIALFFLTFFMIIPMKVKIIGSTINVSLLVMCVLSIIYFIHAFITQRFYLPEAKILGLNLIIILYFIVVFLAGGAMDNSMIVRSLYGLIIFSASIMIARSFKKLFQNDFVEKTLKYIFLIGIVHSIIQILVLFLPELANKLYHFVDISELANQGLKTFHRAPGLFVSGAAVLSTFNAFILLIGTVLFFMNGLAISAYKIILASILFFIQFLAIFFSGRTGFILLLIGLSVYGVYWVFKAKKGRPIILLKFFGRVFVLVIFGILLLRYFVDIPKYENNIKWAFEFIYSINDNGTFSTGSTNRLFETMYFVPEKPLNLIFGTSNFGRSPNLPYINSDSGFILMIFGAGFLGLIIAFSIFLYFYIIAFRYRKNREVSFLVRLFVLLIIAANLKDLYYLAISGVMQILMILVALLVINSKNSPQEIRAQSNNIKLHKYMQPY